MAIRDIFKVSRKTFFNPSGWLDYDGLKNQSTNLYSILKTTYTPDKSGREETFEQAMVRLNLTEEDVAGIIKTYAFYTFVFVLLGLGMFCYAFYLLFSVGSLTGLMLGLGAASLFFAQAFRYDFWSLQMRRRKLGLTFEEWKRHVLGIKGDNK